MVRKLLRRLRNFLVSPVLEILNTPHHTVNVDIGIQILLSLKYKEMAYNRIPLPSFDEIGFREYSGSNEDGILLFIFSLIGTTNKKLVDIGAAGIDGSNVANLIFNHGWIGLLIDADGEGLAWARKSYESAPDIWRFPPALVREFVTTENVNFIMCNHGFTGEIDLLSIDIDGVDYWIWKTIDCMSPRVVVVEYQDIIGPDRALTVPYKPDFNRDDYDVNKDPLINYCGASLPAFVKLAKEKSYRLVGCSRYGLNAFFIRAGVGEEWLPEVPIRSCFKHPRNEWGMMKRWDEVKDMPWVEV